MKKKYVNLLLIYGVVILFFLSSIGSGVTGAIPTVRQDSSTKKVVSTTDDVLVRCTAGGMPITKRISRESCEDLKMVFSELVEANARNPCGEQTKVLKHRFIELLANLGLLAPHVSIDDVYSLIEPAWAHSAASKRNLSPRLPKTSDDENNATLWLCSMAGAGYGFILPPFLLPRPRLVMQWRGFYPDSSAVSVAEMATGRGVIARGTQVGTSFGFIGVGFAFAFPGAPAQFGFIGYSLLTQLQGADMTWYYANFPPLVMGVTPEDGAVDVPLSLSKLQFTLKDYDFDPMTYNVITSPDIGSGGEANVENGAFSIPVSGLESGVTYTWTVTASDGTETTEDSFSFTTEMVAPYISNPLPVDNAQYVPVETSTVSFDLTDYQGDLMDWTVETQPDIGSGSGTDVGNGRYTVPVSGLDYFTSYTWFVNVTDGNHPAKKTFVFKTTAENTYFLPPTDDSYVAYPTEVNGASTTLNVRNGSSDDNYLAAPVLKFDLLTLPANASILSATIELFYLGKADSNPAGRTLTMRHFDGDWNEETITRSNMPPYSNAITGTAIVPDTTGVLVSWDVTSDTQQFFSGSMPNFGWIIRDEQYWGGGSIPLMYFCSKEYGSNLPYLVIETNE